jgi:serine/threonine protein kinase
MEGCELQDLLEDKMSSLSKEQKKDITLIILKTIYRLHAKGIIHGDISPNNLFIKMNTEKGDLKLTLFDFDMAEEFDPTSRNFLTQAKIDIVQTGKLIYGLIFSDELKGEEIGHKEMKDKLNKIEEPSFLEAICKELLNVKITDGQLNLSLKEMIQRFELTN